MSILTNFNTGHIEICHLYREISDDAELVMLSISLMIYIAIHTDTDG
jgi:hypothetical protein